MKFDFSWKEHIDKEKWCRSLFDNDVLYSKQIIYDVALSIHNPKDEVKRHKDLSDPFDRCSLAINLGLVYLLASFDSWLNYFFFEIWTLRRDMLHQWMEDQLPRVKEGNPSLMVSLGDVWREDVRRVPIEEYFETYVFGLWGKKSPQKKLEALQKIVKHRIPDKVISVFDDGLKVRNLFVHPPGRLETTKSRSANRKRTQNSVTEEWYDEVTKAFLKIVEMLAEKVKEATSRTIASNLINMNGLLNNKQKAVFGIDRANSGRLFKTTPKLLEGIEKSINDQSPVPELIILGITADVISNLTLITDFSKRHPDISLIFYEDPCATDVHRADVSRVSSLAEKKGRFRFIPAHMYPEGKHDDSYDQSVELQRRIKDLAKIG